MLISIINDQSCCNCHDSSVTFKIMTWSSVFFVLFFVLLCLSCKRNFNFYKNQMMSICRTVLICKTWPDFINIYHVNGRHTFTRFPWWAHSHLCETVLHHRNESTATETATRHPNVPLKSGTKPMLHHRRATPLQIKVHHKNAQRTSLFVVTGEFEDWIFERFHL